MTPASLNDIHLSGYKFLISLPGSQDWRNALGAAQVHDVTSIASLEGGKMRITRPHSLFGTDLAEDLKNRHVLPRVVDVWIWSQSSQIAAVKKIRFSYNGFDHLLLNVSSVGISSSHAEDTVILHEVEKLWDLVVTAEKVERIRAGDVQTDTLPEDVFLPPAVEAYLFPKEPVYVDIADPDDDLEIYTHHHAKLAETHGNDLVDAYSRHINIPTPLEVVEEERRRQEKKGEEIP